MNGIISILLVGVCLITGIFFGGDMDKNSSNTVEKLVL